MLAICLVTSRNLLIYEIFKKNGAYVAKPAGRFSAFCVTPIRGTRGKIQDLLMVKHNGTISILTYGFKELPLELVRPWKEGDSAVMEVDGVPQSPGRYVPAGKAVLSASSGIDSQVNLMFQDRSQVRATIDLSPKDQLTRQTLYMLALMLPMDEFSALHHRFLVNWSHRGLDQTESVSFQMLVQALCEVFGLATEERLPVPPTHDDSDAWSRMAMTGSAARFREDPVMKKLKVPTPPEATQGAGTQSLLTQPRPSPYLAPILQGLHHVAEDMRLMTPCYKGLLRLVPVICKIASIIRPEWADYWKRLCPDAMPQWPSPAQTGMSLTSSPRIPVLRLWPSR